MRSYLLVSSALAGAVAGLCSVSAVDARESFDTALQRECERAVLHARIARVRSRALVQTGAVVEVGASGQRLAQWYNFNPWTNGDWQNLWPNG